MRPTGSQVTITHGVQTATITEVGANLREYMVAGIAIVEGFAEDVLPDYCRNQLCYPWINRVGGPWEFSHRRATPNVDDVPHATANHGLARWRPFEIAEVSPSSCTLSLVLHPLPDYPFLTKLTITYALGDDGLSIHSKVENLDDVVIPFSYGFHPYFGVTTKNLDGATLYIPAERYVAVDDRQLPTDDYPSVAGTKYDFRQPTLLDAKALDVTYAQLTTNDDGWFTCSLEDANGMTIEISQDAKFPYLQIFTGDHLPEGWNRTSVAIEPMTSPPDALRSGNDLVTLEPESSWTGTWRIQRKK